MPPSLAPAAASVLAGAGADARTDCAGNVSAVAALQRYAIALQFTVRLPVDLSGGDVSPSSPVDVATLALTQTAPASWLCALYSLSGMYAARSALEAGAVIAATNASSSPSGMSTRDPPPRVEALPPPPPGLLRAAAPAGVLVISTRRPDGSEAVLWSPSLGQLAPACAPVKSRVLQAEAYMDADMVRAALAAGGSSTPGGADSGPLGRKRQQEERRRSVVQGALFGNATDAVAAAAAAISAASAPFGMPASSSPTPTASTAASATVTPLQPAAAALWGGNSALPGRLLFSVDSPDDASALRIPAGAFAAATLQSPFPIIPASDAEYAFALPDAASPTGVRPLNSTVLAVHVLIDANMTVGDACAARSASSLLARRLAAPLSLAQARQLLERNAATAAMHSADAGPGRARVLAGGASAFSGSSDIPAWPLVMLQRASSMCAEEDAANAGLAPDPTSILGCQSTSLLVMDGQTSSAFGLGPGLPVAAIVAVSDTPSPSPQTSLAESLLPFASLSASPSPSPSPDAAAVVADGGSDIAPIAGGAAAGGVLLLLVAALAGRYYYVLASRRRGMLQAAAVSLVRVGMAEKALQLTVAGAVSSSATGIVDMLAAEAVSEQLAGAGLALPQAQAPALSGSGAKGKRGTTSARPSRVSFAPAGQGQDLNGKARPSAVAAGIAASFAAAAAAAPEAGGSAPETSSSAAAASLSSPSDSAELRKLRGAAMAAVGRALPASAISVVADAALAAARQAVARAPTVAHSMSVSGRAGAGAGADGPLLGPADALRSMIAAAVDSAERALDALERSGEVALSPLSIPHDDEGKAAARGGRRQSAAVGAAAGASAGSGPAIARRGASAASSAHMGASHHDDDDDARRHDDACEAFVDVWFADMMTTEAALPAAAAAVPLKEQAHAVAARAGLKSVRPPLRRTGGLKRADPASASGAAAAASAASVEFDAASGPGAVARLRAAIEMRLRATQAAKAAVARGDADALRRRAADGTGSSDGQSRHGSHSSSMRDDDDDEDGAVVTVTEGNADEVLAEHASASARGFAVGDGAAAAGGGGGSAYAAHNRTHSAMRTRAPAAHTSAVAAVSINASAALQVAHVGRSHTPGRRAGAVVLDLDVGTDFSAARAMRRRQLQALVICTLSAQARATAQQLAQSLKPGDEQAAAVLAEAQQHARSQASAPQKQALDANGAFSGSNPLASPHAKQAAAPMDAASVQRLADALAQGATASVDAMESEVAVAAKQDAAAATLAWFGCCCGSSARSDGAGRRAGEQPHWARSRVVTRAMAKANNNGGKAQPHALSSPRGIVKEDSLVLQLLASRAATASAASSAFEADDSMLLDSLGGTGSSSPGLGGKKGGRAMLALDDELSALGLLGRRTEHHHPQRHGHVHTHHGSAASKAGEASQPDASRAALHGGSLRGPNAHGSGVRRSFAGTAMTPVTKVRSMHTPRRSPDRGSGGTGSSGGGGGGSAGGSGASAGASSNAGRRSGVGFGFGSGGGSAAHAGSNSGSLAVARPSSAFAMQPSFAAAADDFGLELTAAHTANPLVAAAAAAAAHHGYSADHYDHDGGGLDADASAYAAAHHRPSRGSHVATGGRSGSSAGGRGSISPLHASAGARASIAAASPSGHGYGHGHGPGPASGSRASMAQLALSSASPAASSTARASIAPRASIAGAQSGPRLASSAQVAAAAAAAAAAGRGHAIRGAPLAPGAHA